MRKLLNSKKSKLVTLGVLVFGLILVGFFAWQKLKVTDNEAQTIIGSNSTPEAEETDQSKTSLRLIITGDIIAHDSVNANAKANNGYDYYKLMSNMKPFFDKSDVRFCNQATPAGGVEFGVSGYPVFNAPLQLTDDMVRLGCNLVNLGTNHTYDKGQVLINSMVEHWDKQNILAHAGANRTAQERDTVRYFEQNGVRFGFLSYSTYSNSPVSNGYGVTMYSQALVERQLREAQQKADIVLVSMRWGTEYSPNINARQTQISQFLADNGADIIIGHGPHVLQPVKKLKSSAGSEAVVWYSIGNFLNTQLEIEALTGVIGVVDIDIKSKSVTNIAALPIYNHYEWSTADRVAERLLARSNVQMYALDKANEQLESSGHDTTAARQIERITKVLNQFTPVKILTSSEY